MLPDTTALRTHHARLRSFLRPAAAVLACALLCAGAAPAQAQTAGASGAAASGQAGPSAGSASQRQQAAYKRVSDAVGVVHAMAGESGMTELLGRARGVYIVPSYGRAALGVGAAGGSGVLMARRTDGSWGNPAFYTIGALSIGLQAGAEGGPIALLLMNQKALDHFRNKNNFSLSADAGITVVNFARMARGSLAGDVIAWSGNKGLFGNVATIAVNDIRFNPRLTEAYYGKATTALEALDSVQANPQAEALRKALGSSATPAGTGAR